MGFSKKAKNYFYKELELNNRKISEKMDNYSEALISRYLNSDKISMAFINKIKLYFPQADIAFLINNDVEEINELKDNNSGSFKARTQELIEEIEERFNELKKIVARR